MTGERNEQQRVSFWENRLTDPLHPGICGVDHRLIVDIDETGTDLHSIARRYGYSKKGEPCQNASKNLQGARVSLLMGISVADGVVAPITYRGSLDSRLFVDYFRKYLLPALRGKGRRLITMDNLPAHKKAVKSELMHSAMQEGHFILFRPSCSPDFGPIEGAFSMIKSTLRRNFKYLTNASLPESMLKATLFITKQDIMNLFINCHYYIQGQKYFPYKTPSHRPQHEYDLARPV